MNNQIIVKIYKNEIDSDLHDLVIDTFKEVIREFVEKLANKNIDLYFTFQYNIDYFHDVNEVKCFSEVEYTNELTKEVKDIIVEYVKRLSVDAVSTREKVGRRKTMVLKEMSTVEMIKFKKIQKDEELIFLEKEPISLDGDDEETSFYFNLV